MVSIVSLWLPILVSATLVFVASSIIHMMLTYHRSDFSAVPDEGSVMSELAKFKIPPGEYAMPYAGSPKAMGTPEYITRVKAGPVAFITIMPNGIPSINASLIQWFLYIVVVNIFSAYIAGRALPADAPYLEVFRFIGCTAFMGYSLALWQNSIWYKRAWSVTIKSTFDGLVYASLTAGTFGWLWQGI